MGGTIIALEALLINATHATLNHDDVCILPDTYLHLLNNNEHSLASV